MVRPTWSVGVLLFNGANDVDFKICDDGRDYFRAGADDDFIDGGTGNDLLSGSWANDTRAGGEGDDRL